MKLDIKQIKLHHGEEIITEVIDFVTDEPNILYNAMVVRNPFNVDVLNKSVFLKPYMILTKKNQMHLLNLDHISVIVSPNKTLVDIYKKVMDSYYRENPETIPEEDDIGIFEDFKEEEFDSGDDNIIQFDRTKMH